jgi:hypothetical protein
MLIVSVFHVFGIFFDHFYHGSGIIMSMITGYKKATGYEFFISRKQKHIASYFLYTAAIVFLYTFFSKDSFFVYSYNKKVNYEKQVPKIYEACSECHIFYPPFLLPKESWTLMMNNLNNHFDEELEYDKKMFQGIKNYLIKNSATNSKQESAVNMSYFIKDNNYSITSNQYWINTHKNIPQSKFEDEKVGRKYNCSACHSDIENGIIEDRNILE